MHDSRLARRLGTFDAVVIGLASMIGAGVFAAVGPATDAAGGGVLVALAVAAAVAYCNATSSAQLAARYPTSGGTYVYGRERLGDQWGFAAGWGFVIGKTASCAAMALTFGAYAATDVARPLAIGAVLALTAINLAGVQKTALATRVLVAVVLTALGFVVAACLLGGEATADNIGPVLDAGPGGILRAAGLLFFAFAGYARIATLGEEVRDPSTTIPRAIAVSLGITLAVYALVVTSALVAGGAGALARADAPLAAAVRAGSLADLAPAVRIGASVASLGVLLSLLVGVSRTTFAMASYGDLPRPLDAVHPVRRIPYRAEMAVAGAVIAVVAVADVRGAIGFSSFAVLLYYAIANASALTLRPGERTSSRAVPALGLVGCVVLALSLPVGSVVTGAAVVAVGVLGRVAVRRLG